MQSYPNHETLWVITFYEQQLELMDENAHELELKTRKQHRSILSIGGETVSFSARSHHLECSEILLPPNVFLVFGSHRRHHVIEVHNDVHERVEQREESAVAAYTNPTHKIQ